MATPLLCGISREARASDREAQLRRIPAEHGDGTPGDGLKSVASRDHGEPRLFGRRLLSPEQAAAYLGLRSRFAIYRLVASGRLRALRLANKLRLDLQDLDSMIEDSKVESTGNVDRSQSVPAAARSVPRELAPNRRRRSVTSRVTVQARPN